ncbi:MAG: hypothetical protein VYE22_39545 [Myxococcota bacterium]|nr:hypothetical protein [Myxococcota bacterium]
MADKPKKKRDLRARLGRTITPKTGGGAPAPGGAGGGAVPPPNLGGAPSEAPAGATPAPKGVTPPPGVGGGVAAPPAGIGGGLPGGDVAPPPFAQPQPSQPAPAQPADPFSAGGGAAAAPQQQVVKLEFDDKLVTDQEVGKGKRMAVFIVAAVCLAVGMGVGFFGGSTFENNKIFDKTVADAQDVYASVDDAASTVTAAQGHIDALVEAAAGNQAEGTPPAVNYEAIEALRALEKPFELGAFTGKNYNALQSNTVNDLFQYALNIDELWREFRSLAAQTLPEARREELNETAAATAEQSQTQYGAVLSRAEDGRLFGSLVFLSEGTDGNVMARATRGGQGREFSLFNGGDQEITDSPEFVMLVNGQTSRGVLAEQTGAFGLYLMKIRDLKLKIDSTVEIQGRLLQAISAALTEAGASVRRTE